MKLIDSVKTIGLRLLNKNFKLPLVAVLQVQAKGSNEMFKLENIFELHKKESADFWPRGILITKKITPFGRK